MCKEVCNVALDKSSENEYGINVIRASQRIVFSNVWFRAVTSNHYVQYVGTVPYHTIPYTTIYRDRVSMFVLTCVI